MLRARMPFFVLPTTEAKATLGGRLGAASLCAFVEIAKAEKSLEVAHLQFEFEGATLAVASRVRGDGLVELEIGLGVPSLPKRSFTAEAMRQALARVQGKDAVRRPRDAGPWRSGAARR